MKSNIIALSFILAMLLQKDPLYAQIPASQQDTANYPYWIQMMQDPNVNFFATQSAYNKYWANREHFKGDGSKIFKRWEYITRPTVNSEGKLPPPDYYYNEYKRYTKSSNKFPMSPSGYWQLIGPLVRNDGGWNIGLGRINAIAFDPNNPDIVYAGSPSGGLWKTTNAGSDWSALTTNIPTLGISSIIIDPINPDIIWIGTGDRDNGDAPGMGVFESLDGGITWFASNNGMGNTTVNQMIMHPTYHNVLLAATKDGIFKSIDSGNTWIRKSESYSYKDIKLNPGDPSIVYSIRLGGQFYRSSDGGENWGIITSGVLPGMNAVIGVSPAQPSIVYILQTNYDQGFIGLMKSTDSGLNFVTQSTTPNIMARTCSGDGGNQTWYDLCIAVDPVNPDIIYTGGIFMSRSTDGGITWNCNMAPVHVDLHTLIFNPIDGKLFIGCDGGVFMTNDGVNNWIDLSKWMSISQTYKIGQSATSPNLTLAGFQDNGAALARGSNFNTVLYDDGMECIIDYTDTSYMYGSTQYGSLFRLSPTGGSIKNNITEWHSWLAPFILDNSNPNRMFAGYKNVWRSENVKTNNPSDVYWVNITSNEMFYCVDLAQSPANPDILYILRGDNQIKKTENATSSNPTWTFCGYPTSDFNTDIAAHPTDPNIVYLTRGSTVFKSFDKGASWTDISGSLPDIPINCIAVDKYSNEGIYIGTITGVFYKDATMSDWVQYSDGLPTVNIRELEFYYDTIDTWKSKLKAATYGRGIWESELFSLFSVSPLNQNVDYQSGSTMFNVFSPSTWSAMCDEEWCTVTPSGSGNGLLTVNYLENFETVPRIATITILSPGYSPRTITVSQAGGLQKLTVLPTFQTVPYIAGTAEFNITSNTSWTATDNALWCSVTPNAGTGNDVLHVNYNKNNSAQPRIAKIVVTSSDMSLIQTDTLNQLGFNVNIYEVNKNNVEIYPNPTDGVINLNLISVNNNFVALRIQTLTGLTIFKQLCHGGQIHTLDLQNIEKGCYNLILETNEGLLVKKLVII